MGLRAVASRNSGNEKFDLPVSVDRWALNGWHRGQRVLLRDLARSGLSPHFFQHLPSGVIGDVK